MNPGLGAMIRVTPGSSSTGRPGSRCSGEPDAWAPEAGLTAGDLTRSPPRRISPGPPPGGPELALEPVAFRRNREMSAGRSRRADRATRGGGTRAASAAASLLSLLLGSALLSPVAAGDTPGAPDCTGPAGNPQAGTPAWYQRENDNSYVG